MNSSEERYQRADDYAEDDTYHEPDETTEKTALERVLIDDQYDHSEQYDTHYSP